MDAPDETTSLDNSLPSDACTVCAKLRKVFSGSDGEYTDAQGSLDTIFDTTCPGHGPLFEVMRKDTIHHFGLHEQLHNGRETQDDNMTNNGDADAANKRIPKSSASNEDSSESDGGKEAQRNPRDSDSGPESYSGWFFCGSQDGVPLSHLWSAKRSDNTARLYWHWDPIMAKSCDEPQTPGFGRIVDPEWVDLELVRRWKRNCFALHGDKCRNPFNINSVSPAWIIDTAEKCIVSGADITGYVALSYRWGLSAGFRTTRHLLRGLQEPGALSQGSKLGDSMAPILRNAMELTQAIDERYLWVDAVCIVQDDETHRATQLGLMGGIYATAKLTIVASDGDAAEGILGLRGISPPRRFDQRVTSLFESVKVIFRHRPDFGTGASPYFDRGWTFQEFLLSQRRLIFADGQIHWRCSCAEWTEELIPSEDACFARPHLHHELSGLVKSLVQGMPDFKSLNKILSQYNARCFSFPEDALPGISGFLSLISHTFEGGFLFGLPEMCFDSALMWHLSERNHKGMTKREVSGRNNPLVLGSQLPSWSWVSWQNHGDSLCVLDEDTTLVDHFLGRGSWTVPITQWFTHETPEAINKRPIRSRWFDLRDQFSDTNDELPQGWTKLKPEEVSDMYWRHGEGSCPPLPLHERGFGKYIYQHALFPYQYFWLPVPIATGSQETGSPGKLQTPYISCNTQRGTFTATQFPISYFKDYDRNWTYHTTTVGLLNESGEFCGRLYLQEADDISRFPEANSGRTCKVEIVSICYRQEKMGHSNSWRPHREEEEDPLQFHVCRFVYGVLWVEWIDGVAYRRASGVVDEGEWEKHNLEDVHLVLG